MNLKNLKFFNNPKIYNKIFKKTISKILMTIYK